MLSRANKIYWPFLLILLLLMVLGTINLASATHSGLFSNWSPVFQREMLWKLLGITLICLCFTFKYRDFYSVAPVFYIICNLLLLLVPFLGSYGGGQKNWLQVFGFRFQPSELAKLGLVLMLAYHFKESEHLKKNSRRMILQGLAIILLPSFLLLLVKDIGNSLFFILIGLSLFWSYGLPKRLLLLFVTFCLGAGTLAYFFFMSPYQQERIHNFLDPQRDPQRSGYQLIQSHRAIGSGQLLGKGYKKGQIHRLNYLPTKKTDFIFSVWAEEWGFVGSLFLLLLYLTLFFLIIRLAAQCRDLWARYLCLGIYLMVFWQLVINLAGVLGLMPLTGVPLPFFSQGGSSFISLSLAMGLILNVYFRNKANS